jgi:hypothetical protein
LYYGPGFLGTAAKVNLLVYHSPAALSEAMESFVDYYNYQRYHEALGNVTRRMCTMVGGKQSWPEERR